MDKGEIRKYCKELIFQHVYTHYFGLVKRLLDEGIFAESEIVNKPNDFENHEKITWWVISTWLLSRLESDGEMVLRNKYGGWWGVDRTKSNPQLLEKPIIHKLTREFFSIPDEGDQ